MHIEGALSPELLFKLAERNNVTSLSAGNFSTPDTLWERCALPLTSREPIG